MRFVSLLAAFVIAALPIAARADFWLSKNPDNICSKHWDNGNTLTVIIQP